MKNKLILIVFTLMIISCKNENKSSSKKNSTKQETSTEGYFNLTINAIIENNDTITLYYLEGEEINITKENSIPIEIIGSDVQQTLDFKLDEDVLPTRLIIKYGNDDKRQKIKFLDSKLEYQGKEIVIKNGMFYQFFIPNEYIDFNQAEQIAISTKKNGDYNPIFFSRKILEDKIDYTLY